MKPAARARAAPLFQLPFRDSPRQRAADAHPIQMFVFTSEQEAEREAVFGGEEQRAAGLQDAADVAEETFLDLARSLAGAVGAPLEDQIEHHHVEDLVAVR